MRVIVDVDVVQVIVDVDVVVEFYVDFEVKDNVGSV